MNKTILAILVGAFLISSALYLTRPGNEVPAEKENNIEKEEENNNSENEEMDLLVSCLKESGVIVYGSKTCPACAQLVAGFGGYDIIAPIYVECAEERERCDEEKQTGYVPEIQIKGELYEGGRSPEKLAGEVDCSL
jgi:hypothetical protein